MSAGMFLVWCPGAVHKLSVCPVGLVFNRMECFLLGVQQRIRDALNWRRMASNWVDCPDFISMRSFSKYFTTSRCLVYRITLGQDYFCFLLWLMVYFRRDLYDSFFDDLLGITPYFTCCMLEDIYVLMHSIPCSFSHFLPSLFFYVLLSQLVCLSPSCSVMRSSNPDLHTLQPSV